jgi:DNA-binding response OmpR family regulator
LQRSISTGLRKSGYAVDVTGNGSEGLWQATSNEYDVIVLDIMLPGMDGLTVLSKLRAAGKETHVLLLTAKDTIDDRVRGLRTGADDYLIKPFAFDELLARIDALIRRSHGVKNSVLSLHGLEIDLSAKVVRREGRPIELAPREFALLEYLVLRRGQVVSRIDIEQHIYDQRVEPMSNVVDSAICALRRKIDSPGAASCIQTRRGMGYILHAQPQ